MWANKNLEKGDFPLRNIFVGACNVGVVGMGIQGEYLESGEADCAQPVLGEHPGDCSAQDVCRVLFHQCADLDFSEGPDKARVFVVKLVLQLVPGEAETLCHGDDDVVPAVVVGKKNWLVLALQDGCDPGSQAANDGPISAYVMPNLAVGQSSHSVDGGHCAISRSSRGISWI